MVFEDFKVGMKAHTSKTITETDVILFAGVSTDINPVHLDEETAKKGAFGKRVAHSILVDDIESLTKDILEFVNA